MRSGPETRAEGRQRARRGRTGPCPALPRGGGLGLAIVLFLALAAPAQAQIWTTFNLSGGAVFGIAAGDSGTVLLATNRGPLRYDGFRFRRLPIFSPTGDSLIAISILETRGREVWTGSDARGLFRLETDGTVLRYTASNGLGNNSNDVVTALAEGLDGKIWAATQGGGLSYFDGTTWGTVTTDQGLPSPYVTSLAVDPRDGAIWAGTQGGGLARIVGTSVAAVYPAPGIKVNAVLVSRAGQVWVGLDQGVGRLEGSTFVTYFGAATLANRTVIALFEGAHGELWCGTVSGGVARFDGVGAARFYGGGNGPVSDLVTSLYVDPAGVLWVGTNSGLSRFEGASWTVVKADEALPTNAGVWSAARDVSTAARGDSVDVYGVTWMGLNPVFISPLETVNLARRTNGHVFLLGTAEGMPAGNVSSLALDGAGGVWAGSRSTSGGVAHVTGTAVTRVLRTADGLPAAQIFALRATPSGGLWVGTSQGAAYFDGVVAHALPVGPQAVPDHNVRGIDLDAQGRVWIATGLDPTAPFLDSGAGAVLFDPRDSSYTRFTRAQGLASDSLNAVTVLPNGDVWFASAFGATRLAGGPGGAVRTFTVFDGLPSSAVTRIVLGPDGRVWAGCTGGIAVFDGTAWSAYGGGDGVAGGDVGDLFADGTALLVACRGDGLSYFVTDPTPPRAEVQAGPPAETGSSFVQFAFRGADVDGGARGLALSTQIDMQAVSAFSEDVTTLSTVLPDGEHDFRVWARDRGLNVSPVPFTVHFTVDHTPPRPVVAQPTFNEVVHGTENVLGQVADTRFVNYTVEIRPQGSQTWATLLVSTALPAPGDSLYAWDTTKQDDGPWELRVSVHDNLELVGYAQVTAIVDNLAPGNSVTSPAKVDHVKGGKVYTTQAEVEIDFPPDAFPSDQIVHIDPVRAAPSPSRAPSPGARWIVGWELRAGQTTLARPATLIVQSPGLAAGEVASLFELLPDSTLVPLGGTPSADGKSVTVALSHLGTIEAYAGAGLAGGGFDGVRDLDCQPRVISPHGGGFDTRLAISFDLGKTAPAAVKVYDRAGRLVREVAEAQTLPAGRNVLFWDGKDGGGAYVPSGLYVVAVRVDARTTVKTVAVANR